EVGLGGGEVLLAREEEGDVDGDAGEDRLLDGGKALFRARNLNEEVGARGAREQIPGGAKSAIGVVGKQGRDFERNPAVDGVCPFVYRLEKVGRASKILQGQLEEKVLAGFPAGELVLNRSVVGRA